MPQFRHSLGYWSESLLKKMVLLRFGSFNRPSPPVLSYRKVAAKIGRSEMSVYRRLKLYEETGQLVGYVRRGGRPRADTEFEKLLCSRTLLQDWSAFSLEERVSLIEKEFGRKVSKSYIHNVYRRQNIRYRKMQEVKRQAWRRRFELDG